MALVKCKECGREIAKGAEGCPGCGAKVNSISPPSMVLWILFGLIIIVLISVGYSIGWLHQ